MNETRWLTLFSGVKSMKIRYNWDWRMNSLFIFHCHIYILAKVWPTDVLPFHQSKVFVGCSWAYRDDFESLKCGICRKKNLFFLLSNGDGGVRVTVGVTVRKSASDQSSGTYPINQTHFITIIHEYPMRDLSDPPIIIPDGQATNYQYHFDPEWSVVSIWITT